MRRFPPPWSVEKIPGGLKVCDANGQSLAYVFNWLSALADAMAPLIGLTLAITLALYSIVRAIGWVIGGFAAS